RRRGSQRVENRCLAKVTARREQNAFLAEHLDRLACRPHSYEGLEKMGNRLPNLGVSVEDHIAGIVVHETSGQDALILAALYLVENAAAQSRLQYMQLGFAHRPFEAQ